MTFLAHVTYTNILRCFTKFSTLNEVVSDFAALLMLSDFMISKFDFSDFRQGIRDFTGCRNPCIQENVLLE